MYMEYNAYCIILLYRIIVIIIYILYCLWTELVDNIHIYFEQNINKFNKILILLIYSNWYKNFLLKIDFVYLYLYTYKYYIYKNNVDIMFCRNVLYLIRNTLYISWKICCHWPSAAWTVRPPIIIVSQHSFGKYPAGYLIFL